MYRVLTPADRARAWAITAVITGLMGWLIAAGLAVGPAGPRDGALEVFSVVPPPPPPRERVIPERTRRRAKAGEAAPPNLRATPKEVVAPEPIVPPLTPPPLPAPPIAATGPDASSGASNRPGPGTGAGGIGNGRGSGGDGDGTGGDDRFERRPRLIRDRISMRDYPDALMEAGISTNLDLRYTVTTEGRVINCRVVRSSGYPAVDAMTCREVERNFRYRPWRDADGRPVPSTVLREMELNVEPDDRRR